MLAEIDVELEFEPITLGKKFELRYIPFSELSVPWNVTLDTTTSSQDGQDKKQSSIFKSEQINTGNAKFSRTLRNVEFNALKRSIAQFGLLKPFEVAEMQERLDFFFGKGKYLIIDGQRRYFAIRELLKLPTEDEEREQRDSLRSDCPNGNVAKGELQAQEKYDKLSMREHVLIPCLVYPYTTVLQMVRHSIEDRRFCEKPSKEEIELAEKMVAEGIGDLNPDDLRDLWKRRSQIDEEKRSIIKTLQEIRNMLG